MVRKRSSGRRVIAVMGLSAITAGSPFIGGSQLGAKSLPAKTSANTIDPIAWRQFILAVAPSGSPGKVRYETWASDQDIYVSSPCAPVNPAPGCNRPSWPSPGSARAIKAFQPSVLGHSLTRAPGAGRRPTVEVIGPAQGCSSPIGIQPGGAAINSGFPASGCVGEEVRRDRASFTYLVRNGLWSKAGLASYFTSKRAVALPWNALEVKADWIPVATLSNWIGQPASFITANFYTASASVGTGAPTVYAMTSMHLSVKTPGFPNWVWANFENAYTPGRCDQTGCSDSFGATKTSVPAKSTPWGQYGACPKTNAVTAMMAQAGVAAVFANYCLTGSQSAFGTTANPTVLGSPVIETVNADVPLATSSCISCHAGASFQGSNVGPVGEPLGPNAPPKGYTAYDFLWGLLLAQ